MRTRMFVFAALLAAPFLCTGALGFEHSHHPAPPARKHAPDHPRDARFEEMLKEFPPEMQERLNAVREDPKAFRKEVNRCFNELRRKEYDEMMKLRDVYLNAKTDEERAEAKERIRVKVSERMKKLDAAAERRIQENEARLEQARAQLDALKKMHAERLAESEKTIDRIVSEFTDPEAEPSFQEMLNPPPRRAPGPDRPPLPPPPPPND